jgi:hypothetical protein
VTAGDPTASPTPADDPVRFQRAADSLPKLTRAVLLLSAIDDMPYDDIALRCGISEDEVRVRLADALIGLGRAMRGPLPWTGQMRLALQPWRSMWARARAGIGPPLGAMAAVVAGRVAAIADRPRRAPLRTDPQNRVSAMLAVNRDLR